MHGSRWFKGDNGWYKHSKRLEIWWLTQGNHANSHGMILDPWNVKINAMYNAFVSVDKRSCLKFIKSTRPIVITIK